jgi:hypothetical protein
VYGSNPSLIVQNSAIASVGNTTNIIFRNLLSTGCIHFAGYIAGIQGSTSANTGDLSFNTYNNGSIIEGMRISCGGNVGINCASPGYTIDVNGNAHFRADGGTMLIESTSPTNSSTLRIIQCATGGNGNTDQGLVVQTNAGDGTSNIANFYDYNNGSPVSRVRFQRSGIVCFAGNVGIGVSPGYKLDVSSGASGIVLNLDGTNAYNAETGIQMASNRAKISAFLNGAGGTPGSSLRLYTMPDGGSVTERMRIDSNGLSCFYNSVGIGGGLAVGSTISAGGSLSGTLLTSTTQRLSNSTGNFANMVHKVYGAAGAFSCLVICVNLNAAGGWGYIINTGGTGLGQFQSGGGYINSPGNFSHGVAVGSGFTVTCHTCAGTNDLIRFMSSGGVHPFASIQMFGSLNQFIDDSNIYMCYF